jgi:hypothetical protein
MARHPKVIPDPTYPGMFRVRWPDGLSDMTNLSRAKDAVAAFMDSADRRQRERQSQLEARLGVASEMEGGF